MNTVGRMVLAIVGLLALTGCGGDDPQTFEVEAVDYGYEGLPDEIPVGSDIVLRNSSAVELHEFVAVRLEPDEDRSAETLLALPPEEFGPLLGAGLQSVIIAPPGAEGMVVEGSATLDKPGRYLVICLIPTGADPDEYLAAAAEAEGGPPDVDGGPPHIAAGMWAELVVD